MRVNLSVGQRIGAGFFLLMLMLLVATGLGVLLIQSVTTTIDTSQSGTQQIQTIRTLEQRWASVAATVDRMLLTRQTSLIDQTLQENLTAFNQELAGLQNRPELLANPEAALILNSLDSFGIELNGLVIEITGLAQDGRWAQAQARRHTEMTSIQRRFDINLEQLNELIESEVESALTASVSLQATLRFIWIITVGLTILGGIVVAYLTVISITQPVKALIAQVEQVTQRNFAPMEPLARQDEIGELSQKFALMTDWLRQSYEDLEKRVAQRTQALQASGEVSRTLSTILELDKLVIEVVNQIQTTFRYYHVHIYLIDDTDKNVLRMMGGTGEAGQTMLINGHRLNVGQGLVGRAARTNTAVLVPDVALESDWLPNPLLPETKAEVAVPISLGPTVLGVLDVQHNVPYGLTEEDAEMLRLIANQFVVAHQNAHYFLQKQKEAEYEGLLNEIRLQIQQTTDVDEALKVTVRELGRALGSAKTAVRLNIQQTVNGHG